jgi:hypothetical protein
MQESKRVPPSSADDPRPQDIHPQDIHPQDIHPQDIHPQDQRYAIRIGRDGTWYYQESPIRRIELAKLFATVLRRDEAGDFWLVTPVERGRIAVDDAPFVAVALQAEGEGRDRALVFRTNLDHTVVAGPENPIRVDEDPDTGEPRPYIRVSGGLEARIARPVFYELVEMGEERPGEVGTQVGIWSKGEFFVLGSFGAP